MTLRVVIADDEAAAREKLRRLLGHHPDIAIVAEATNGDEVVACVRDHVPDLLLLDIRMPAIDGLGALRALARQGAAMPKVVFVTAHDEYALEAFDVRAFDYVLKPFDASRLDTALMRVKSQVDLELRPSAESLQLLLRQLNATPIPAEIDVPGTPFIDQVCIREPGRIHFVQLAEVEWIEACGNYLRLHHPGGHPLARETLRSLIARLDPEQFVRIHRSAIVNLRFVREMRPQASGDSVMRLESGVRLRVSRVYRPQLDRWIERFR